MKKEGKLLALGLIGFIILILSSFFVYAQDIYGSYPGSNIDKNLITCIDSDFGEDYLEQGITRGIEKKFSLRKNIEKTDYCIDDKNLIEYYCENGFVKSITYKCLGNCENGKCVVKTPEEYEKKKKKIWIQQIMI